MIGAALEYGHKRGLEAAIVLLHCDRAAIPSWSPLCRVFAAFAAIAFLAQISLASAGEYGTRDEAVAMVKRVEDMFAKAGADSTFKAVSDKSVATFHDRDLYPFI
jgi:hypothetical protein